MLLTDPVIAEAIRALPIGLAVGVMMGLLGGGGGILAVPLLVGLLGMSFDRATTVSLVVIAVASIIALIPHHRVGSVDWRTGITFGLLGAVGAILGGRGALLLNDTIQQIAFAVLLMIAGGIMLRNALRSKRGLARAESEGERRPSMPRLVTIASGVGLTSGFFGVGGAFIAVPALVSAVGMKVRRATATGLLVVIINAGFALIARYSELGALLVVSELAVGAVVGAIIGALVARRLPGWALSMLFGSLILIAAVYTVATA